VGRQLGELNLFNEAELDQVLSGIKVANNQIASFFSFE
jgi:hypothetical protein